MLENNPLELMDYSSSCQCFGRRNVLKWLVYTHACTHAYTVRAIKTPSISEHIRNVGLELNVYISYFYPNALKPLTYLSSPCEPGLQMAGQQRLNSRQSLHCSNI